MSEFAICVVLIASLTHRFDCPWIFLAMFLRNVEIDDVIGEIELFRLVPT